MSCTDTRRLASLLSLYPMPVHISLFGGLELSLHIILKDISDFAFNPEHHLHTSRLKDPEGLGSTISRQDDVGMMGNDVLGSLDSGSSREILALCVLDDLECHCLGINEQKFGSPAESGIYKAFEIISLSRNSDTHFFSSLSRFRFTFIILP
jgi:hypothetical protein